MSRLERQLKNLSGVEANTLPGEKGANHRKEAGFLRQAIERLLSNRAIEQELGEQIAALEEQRRANCQMLGIDGYYADDFSHNGE